jgi:hypothetical protein
MAIPSLLVQTIRDKDIIEQDIINVIAVYEGKAPDSVGIQRIFAGEESFKFPTGVTEGLTKTRVVYSYTLSQWHELLEVCVLSQTAQSIKEIMVPLLLHFQEKLPSYFEDIDYDINFSRDFYAGILEMD